MNTGESNKYKIKHLNVLVFWLFDDFRCGALLFMVIIAIYKYKNK